MQDKISVIVPAYNIEKYISNAVESICNQTHKNLEIILVDDGSTDGTPELLDELCEQDHRIKVLHKANGGVTSARFAGMETATGDWIGFVDGDDYIEPEMYERLLALAEEYHAEISHCGYQMVFPSRVDLHYGTEKIVEQDKETGLKDLLEGKFIEPGLWNKLFCKSLVLDLLYSRKMDFSIKNTEDLLMNFYLFQGARKSIFSDQCYYHYMVRKGSAATSSVNANKLYDPLKVLKIILKETENAPALQQIVKRRIGGQLIGLSTLANGGQKELIEPYRASARRELRKMLPEVLSGDFGKKQKVMALWVSIWPASYRWVHGIYAKITGIDKKYDVN